MRKIEQGQIWELEKEMVAKTMGCKERRMILEPGEKIEIRFPYEWHFRTEDNEYLQAPEKEIYASCKYVGTIFQEVQRGVAELSDILRLKLYNTR